VAKLSSQVSANVITFPVASDAFTSLALPFSLLFSFRESTFSIFLGCF